MRPPIREPVFLKLSGLGSHSPWYFLEDDEKDHLKGTTGFAREVRPKLDETDWHIMRQWVDGCLERHQSHCPCRDSFDVPGFKVIDCRTRKLVPWHPETKFAALSYVWGSPGTAPDQKVEFTHIARDRNVLPKFTENVIEDALVCASKLNIPYLWVDRYCIDQEDTHDKRKHDEKQRLIQSMDQIYSSATVTIIAAAGIDASAGLPGVSKSRHFSPQSRIVLGSHKMISVVNPNDDIRTSKWATRGWTLQEGLLARRRLVFTDTRVLFQCTQSHYIEGLSGEFDSCQEKDYELDFYPRLATRAFPNSVIGSDTPSSSIASVCHDFTSRDLTNDEDALKACLGIFSRFWTSEKPEYQYWGLPFKAKSNDAFVLSLLWKVDPHRYQYPETYGLIPFRRGCAPSWSWLGWRGEMGFYHRYRQEDCAQSQLCVDIKIPRHQEQALMSTISDYIEHIDGGGLYQEWLPYLRLSGWIATLRFETHRGDFNTFDGYVKCYLPLGQSDIGEGQILPPMWANVLENEKGFNPSRLLDVILITHDGDTSRVYCLAIHPVEGKTDTYERLGVCEVYCDSPEIKEIQNTSYLIARGGQSWERRDLECRFKTITLV
ncbi:hypothetical protein PFICI_12030 [Pestalotiopsis fici W106-1]|uniref:Heterokaryon incompatibility domain-containing protein n=1 Tax=Pestalotiopsis fici (strain W106-1 / CGMCC3.15140) TaxID=1229662 RepID=W3WS20_PESFW|nr:uncharacterized protein PFICI_12030 [Pestalotiopsis fici W106-1]ETS76643.1 hypothetical protein PFICI_12030 [Pestalotiopsis fici W106-1]